MKNRLKVLRAARDWTQADLALALEVSRQTVNAIETGKYDPSLPLAIQAGAAVRTIDRGHLPGPGRDLSPAARRSAEVPVCVDEGGAEDPRHGGEGVDRVGQGLERHPRADGEDAFVDGL